MEKEPTHLIYIFWSKQDTESCQGTKWLSLRKLVAGENHEGLLAAEMFYILITISSYVGVCIFRNQQAKNLKVLLHVTAH